MSHRPLTKQWSCTIIIISLFTSTARKIVLVLCHYPLLTSAYIFMTRVYIHKFWEAWALKTHIIQVSEREREKWFFPPFVCAGKMFLFWSAIAWSGRNDDNGAPIVLRLIHFLSSRRLINCFPSLSAEWERKFSGGGGGPPGRGANWNYWREIVRVCLSGEWVKLECAAALVCVFLLTEFVCVLIGFALCATNIW